VTPCGVELSLRNLEFAMLFSSLRGSIVPFFLALAFAPALARASASVQDCAFPAVPKVRVLYQPDGSPIELHFRGTSANHWYEDLDGFPVVRSAAGYVYARRTSAGGLAATDALVGSADPRLLDLERRIVPKMKPRAPSPGAQAHAKRARTPGRPDSPGRELLGNSVENLVLLLRFSNHGPSGQNRTLPSSTDVSTIMNAVGGDPSLAPTGSVRDHYLETSYGQFSIDSTVVGWLDMPSSESYYADGSSGLTTQIWELITDGLDAADATVDFSDYDLDGNGWIDAITFLHSGYGAEWGGSDQYGTDYADRIWSHKWTIPTWTSAEGVSVGDYNISPGLWDTTGSDPGRIGVVCHELGHFFGLPDLYDTDGSSYGAGGWCLMAYGSWGFDFSQQYPSHLCAWAKMKLGWASPQRLTPGTYSALAIEDDPSLFMIDSGYPSGEYLLVENRQPTGFDAVIPQGGLAVWHVDEGKGSFTLDDPNTDEGYPGQSGWPGNNEHYRVALLQADGDFDLEQGVYIGDSSDVYRSPFVTVLDATTTPDTDAYQGGSIVVNSNRLESIGASSSSMSFTYVNTAAPTITTTSLPVATPQLPYSVALTRTGGSSPFAWTEFLEDPSYTLTDLGSQSFTSGGTAQGWQADEGVWSIDLPFLFPYYETSYDRVYVTPNGCVDFAPLEFEFYNTTPFLQCLPRIAGLWDDLVTDSAGGQDIYLDTSVSGQVRIRWQAEPYGSGLPANFAITLHEDGRIRLDYGSGNTGLTPTVGLSRAHDNDMTLVATHDAQTSLTNANSIELQLQGSALPPGFTLSSAGVLSGTPTVAGTYAFRVRVTDALGRYDEEDFSLTVRRKSTRREYP
jgi:M6 family metalloprotease-like protein